MGYLTTFESMVVLYIIFFLLHVIVVECIIRAHTKEAFKEIEKQLSIIKAYVEKFEVNSKEG